jgi:hypothetical protein
MNHKGSDFYIVHWVRWDPAAGGERSREMEIAQLVVI